MEQEVQWFPGHMAKTRRQIKEYLPSVDAALEILDARIPYSSANPELSSIIGNKPRVILLNKCDLADERSTGLWIKYFEKEGIRALPVDCRSGSGLNSFYSLIREVLADTISRNEKRGMPGKALRLMVVGIPNTGKSSFINRMAKKNKAVVADRPGVTRKSQWFPIGNGIELLDTPGVLWPKFDDPAVGDKLAFIGSVKDEILDSETIALRLIGVLSESFKGRLEKRYGITPTDGKEAYEILEEIGKKRGMLIRGGEIDIERASGMLLDEYRAGRLGRITFELP
ncbi:MAG: ribosome biogenesis GTPase YlqF [Clostridiales bacterium]|nr:ribosome biogenesis GTPase YlqF [Clostridiales bacterium]